MKNYGRQSKKRKWRWIGHTLRKEGTVERDALGIPEKRSPMGNMEKDGDKRVGREGKVPLKYH
jgi:hypothetical protein